ARPGRPPHPRPRRPICPLGSARGRPGMSTEQPATPPAAGHPSPVRETLTLVLVCILVGVVAAGLMADAPGLGVLLLVLLAPVLVRLAIGPPGQADAGRPRTGAQKVMGALGSLGVLIAIGVASFAAFYATCFVVCLGGLAVEQLSAGREGVEWIFFP